MPAEKPVTLSSKALDDAVKSLMMGLVTDGAHHKQWCIEMALRFIVTDAWVDNAKAKFQWESGSAP